MDVKSYFFAIFFITFVVSCSTQRGYRTCEMCQSSPSTCRRVSGLYTTTALTEGSYNKVVEIPASACGINVTELGYSKNYIGVKTTSDKGILNSHWALGRPGQYYGAGTRFAYDRGSGNCRGSCIYAEGPTQEKTVVQLLYYGQNPGILYEFTIPNSVPFQAVDEPKTKLTSALSSTSISSPASSSSLSSSSSSSSAAIIASRSSSPQTGRHKYRQIPRRRGNSARSPSLDSRREYYSGSQTSRSEGRPDVTAAQGAPVSYRRRIVPNQRTPYDYTSTKYGTHTLGGRGQSYTKVNNPRSGEGRIASNQKGERYVSGSSRLQKIAAPQYRHPTSNSRLSHSRQQPRYQSLTASRSYRNEATQRTNDRYRLRGLSSSRDNGNGRFRWKISGLTKCSRTCGGGVQKTNIVCVSISSRTQVVVTPENCANSRKPRSQTVECNNNPCEPSWEADDWSECSVTCGSGTQTRKIECRQRFSGSLTLRVSADQCGLDKKPAVAQQCEKDLCKGWSSGVWGQCSKECGGGEKRRDVKCVDGLNSPIPSNYCTDARPKDREICNNHPCNAKWWTSDWSSSCSKSCGAGYQVRSALCMSNGYVAPESKCRKADYPSLTKACSGDNGCRGTWFTGSWGRCSPKCGKGKRRRAVLCLQPRPGGKVVVADGQCTSNLKPIAVESCVNNDCSSLWFSSPWSECSVTCGDGFKARDVSCIDKKGKSSTKCPSTLTPKSQEGCSFDPCDLYQRTDGRYVKTEYTPETEFDDTENEANVDKYKDEDEEEKEDQEEDQKEEIDSEDEYRDEYEDGIGSVEEDAFSKGSYEEHGNSNEISSEIEDNDDANCKDKYWNCLMVIQARLCHYDFYRDQCCVSCRSVI